MFNFFIPLNLAKHFETQNIDFKEKPLETIVIHVEKREWNIDAINELLGFDEENPESMSNLEIATMLQTQAYWEYRRHRHLLDCRKEFVLGYAAEDSEDDGYHD
ncbi:hypothetical protein JAO10_09150 [Burkholderia contaminans]|uniref:hypothetical protein n=1 Tax=Burkholderia cepacia complex TaxID=87882 RepID=UPI001593F72D|nr:MULTISPECIES: hypothetical protein [Burkholderia cepacia complex]MBH9720498.1 hypothetical protein [Burkholderia contaminans]